MYNTRKKLLTLGTSLLALSALPMMSVQAEDDDTVSPFDEIIVTGQFRNQKLQDVAAPVTAFTAQDIEDAGVRTTDDFVAMTPNLTFDDSFTYLNSFVVVRGVTQINNADSPWRLLWMVCRKTTRNSSRCRCLMCSRSRF